MYQCTARAITSPGKAWWEKALVERDVKRRPHTLQRQHCPPSRVCPSLRIRSLPHRMHFMASAFSSSCADYLHHPHRIVYAAMRTLSPPRGPGNLNFPQPQLEVAAERRSGIKGPKDLRSPCVWFSVLVTSRLPHLVADLDAQVSSVCSGVALVGVCGWRDRKGPYTAVTNPIKLTAMAVRLARYFVTVLAIPGTCSHPGVRRRLHRRATRRCIPGTHCARSTLAPLGVEPARRASTI